MYNHIYINIGCSRAKNRIQLLKTYGITQSMSREGNPRDNAVAVSLIGHFKRCTVLWLDFKNSNNPEDTIRQADEYFNYYRPAHALQYKSPSHSIEQGYDFFVSTKVD